MHNQLTEAVINAAEYGAPPRVYEVGPNAVIQLAEGTGHLLTGATITAWVSGPDTPDTNDLETHWSRD